MVDRMVTTDSYILILNYLFNIPSIMANEEPKELGIPYVILTKNDSSVLQTEVNRRISKWYIPYWQLFYNNWVFIQCLADPLILERQQLTVRAITKWALATTSTVTIPGTVNVSWCECNCW